MMDLIKENAFGILGILPDATQKEISKKGKELPKLLKLGEVPCYPLDFDFYSSYRNESSVTEATNDLTSIRTHILHSFFRIYPVTEKEKEEIQRLSNCSTLQEKINYTIENEFIKEKNRLVILLIYLYQSSSKRHFSLIMNAIDDILEKFVQKETIITDFKKLYKLTDELGIDDKIFVTIKGDIALHLIYIFSNIAQDKNEDTILYGALKYLSSFIKSYKDIPLLNKVLTDITLLIERIKDIPIRSLEKNKQNIRQCLEKIQLLFNKTIEMNIYDALFFQDFKDEFCHTLSEKSVSYYNDTGDADLALGLIKVAQDIGGSISTNSKLKESVETLIKLKKEDSEPFVEFYLKKNKPYPKFCFYNTFLRVYTYNFWGSVKTQDLLYKNIDGYGCYVLRTSTNGIPTGVSHDLRLLMNQNYYTYSCSTSGWSRDDTKSTDYYSIVGMLDRIVKPLILEKIIHKIFDLDGEYNIGSICFNKKGMSTRGFFSTKELLWKDIKYKAEISSGYVYIYNEKRKIFTSASLNDINAPIIPDLIQEIVTKVMRRV